MAGYAGNVTALKNEEGGKSFIHSVIHSVMWQSCLVSFKAYAKTGYEMVLGFLNYFPCQEYSG